MEQTESFTHELDIASQSMCNAKFFFFIQFILNSHKVTSENLIFHRKINIGNLYTARHVINQIAFVKISIASLS